MLRIGTRGSDLALWQAHHVADVLRAAGHEVEIEVLKTRGDRIDDIPLHQLTGSAFFTAEIELALRKRRVDLAVHSHKDLPVAEADGLVIAAVPPRAAPGERLLVDPGAFAPEAPLLPLRLGARVGTSSPRRTEQLLALRPDLVVAPLRGNVPTRVRRLREGRHDAVVLAAAGLDRLALDVADLGAVDLPVDLLVPAPAQGALAVQTRGDDAAVQAIVREHLHAPEAAEAVAAERTVLAAGGGGCSLPLGCVISRTDGRWLARAFAGRDVPREGAPPRWAAAQGNTPTEAAEAVSAILGAATATGQGPLAGLRIALAGSSAGPSLTAERLVMLGADPVHEHVIDFEPVAGAAAALAAGLADLRPGDAVAITSREAARRLGRPPLPDGVLVAAVGPSTARLLGAGGFAVDHVGAGGAAELGRTLPLRSGARVLFPCAEDARQELEAELRARGVECRRCPLYRTVPRNDVRLERGVDARVYMSPSAVAAAREVDRPPFAAARRVAIGRTTAEACERSGLPAESPPGRDPELLVHMLARQLVTTRDPAHPRGEAT